MSSISAVLDLNAIIKNNNIKLTCCFVVVLKIADDKALTFWSLAELNLKSIYRG